MKATGIILAIVSALLLAGGAFFGYFSYQNAGAAERLALRAPRGAEFIVHIVQRKSEKQRNLSLGLAGPGILALGAGIFMIKKGKKGGHATA